jgi:hypothetical protein
MPRGCAPGERRGGRKPGVPNRATANIKALAQPYGAPAIAELAKLAGLTKAPGAMLEATRVAALRELLDRGFGKATQHIGGDVDAGPIHYTFSWASATPEAAPAIEGQPETAGDDDTHSAAAPLTLVWQNES